MPSKKQKPYLKILDVGHGNAAVLLDEGGAVVIDTGLGAKVSHYLESEGIKRIEAMLLSHADADHIGGALTLLLNNKLRIKEVLLNVDPSKNSDAFEQLKYALAEAFIKNGTKIDRRLAVSTSISRKGATIEILHPEDVAVLGGVGSKKGGKTASSNSLSAAIRVSRSAKCSVLLAGDIEVDCVDGWKDRKMSPAATYLVFPHHGGLPGGVSESDASLFAYELVKLVSPKTVIFSNHRTKHGNPRDKIVAAISKADANIQCACTQLPERFSKVVKLHNVWALHRAKNGEVTEGAIRLVFGKKSIQFRFEPDS